MPSLSEKLRNFEGEYHYPSGLLKEAADTIDAQRALLKESEWKQKHTTLRKGTIITVEQCWCCGADRDLQPSHDPGCRLQKALEE